MTTNFRSEHKKKSDDELLNAWCNANQPNSEQSQQLEELMRFRAAMAQNRAAIATENYTKLTGWLLVVTTIGLLVSLFCK